MASLNDFYAISVALTGYNKTSLQGTGVGDAYLSTLLSIVGEPITEELFAVYNGILAQDASEEVYNQLIRNQIMSNEKLGPVARNIIKMWYTANWNQMPQEWTDRFGTFAQDDCGGFLDTTHVVSGEAYEQGLVWLAMEAHPMGAKQPGYGTWAFPPQEETV